MPDIFSHFPNPSNKPCFNPHEYIPNQRPDMHGSVYLSPRKPIALQFFGGLLYELEIGDDFIRISRQVTEWSVFSAAFLVIERYDKNNVLIDRRDEFRGEEFPEIDFEGKSDTYQTKVQPLTPQSGYSYAIVQIHDYKYTRSDVNISIKECISKSKQYAYIEYKKGIVRVNKKILSDVSTYFKQLFQNRTTNKYQVDIDLFDFMELINVLPPYNCKIMTGVTYRALYVLSDQLKCIGIADICATYMNETKQYLPLYASYIARDAGVWDEAKSYNEYRKFPEVFRRQLEFEERNRFDFIFNREKFMERLPVNDGPTQI